MTDHDLTRHTLGAKPATSGPPVTGMWPSPDGDWVKHDEAAARIADLHRKLDELVAAVMTGSRYSFDGDINRCRTCGTPLGVDCPNHCARALAARIKTTQPKGAWIDIKPDGSNLPEHVEGAEWCCAFENSPDEWLSCDTDHEHMMGFGGWDDDLECFVYLAVQPVAYWSIPHIDLRPAVPPYQPKQSYHDRIMNVPVPVHGAISAVSHQIGHRDARHACGEIAAEADAALAAAREEVERLRVERDRFHGLATHYDDVLRQAADALIVEREPDGSPCTAGKSPVLWVLHGLDTIRSAASADARIAELEAVVASAKVLSDAILHHEMQWVTCDRDGRDDCDCVFTANAKLIAAAAQAAQRGEG